MKIALAQINTTIGDLEGNRRKMLEQITNAKAAGCGLIIFPEMAITGYPPGDLVLTPTFISDQLKSLETLAAACTSITVVTGYLEPNKSGRGKPLYNAAAVLADGKIQSRHFKTLLPTYDIFDEGRYFEPAGALTIAKIVDQDMGVSICEDLWNQPGFEEANLYHRHPVDEVVAQGAEWVINISASPFQLGKPHLREQLVSAAAKRLQRPVLYVNLVGGNDSLIFDGGSLAADAQGNIVGRAPLFEEHLLIVDFNAAQKATSTLPAPAPAPAQTALQALVLGLRDYVRKCGFKNVVIGLSGGIDSAVVASIAVQALGAENVWGVALPSRYSAGESERDARQLADTLGIRFDVISIEKPFAAFLGALSSTFGKKPADVTEENLQARIRGTSLMALSNKFGCLLLTTGNKSEMAVGYCTLYGDMNGGLAVISDVPKMLVYDIAREINRDKEIIPKNTITRAPTAELRPDQKDSDSLPDYAVLDPILKAYVEDHLDPAAIVAKTGSPPELVTKIIRMVDRAEYKRRQAPPGLRITGKAFGSGRRLPIAQVYKP